MKWIIALLLAFSIAFAANPHARPTDTLLGNCQDIGLNDASLCSMNGFL